MFNLHAFLDFDRNAHTVDTGLDQAALLITLADEDGFSQKGGIVLELNLWVDLALNHLRGEVPQVEHGLEVQPDVAQVVRHGLCHLGVGRIIIL